MRRRTTYAVLCAVFALFGVAAIVAGVVLATTFGQRGELRSAPTALSGPGAALVAESLRADASSIPIPDNVGTLTIEVSPVGPRALFIGTTTQAPLDGYLTAVPYDVITELNPGGTATVRSVPGGKLPPPPQGQTFWITAQTGAPGAPVSIGADLGNQTSLVVMNAVPSNGVEADVRVTLTVAWAWPAALALLGGGVVLVLLALLLGWRSRVAGRRARAGLPARSHGAEPGESLGATILPGPAADEHGDAVVPPPIASARRPTMDDEPPTQLLPALGRTEPRGAPPEEHRKPASDPTGQDNRKA